MTALKSLAAATVLTLLLIAAPAEAGEGKPGKLIPSAVSAAKQRNGQVEVAFGFQVRNAGKGAQRSRNAYLALVQPGAPDTNLGQVTLPRLKAGESITRQATLPIGPTTPGTYGAQVCVRSVKVLRCARSEDQVVIEPPALNAQPAGLDFGSVLEGGTSQTQSVTLTNAGDTSTGVLVTALAGADAGRFDLVGSDCDAVLAGGQSCEARVRFSPPAPGASTARLTVGDGATEATVPLSGTGLAQARIEVTPSPYDFGDVLINSTASKTFTFENTGDVATSPIDSVGVSGDANWPGLSNDACFGATLAPGATCTVDVQFKPLSRGSTTATLSVHAGTGGTATANLGGFGAQQATLSISPSANQDYGNVLQNTNSAKRTYTVTNTGDLPSGALSNTATGDAVTQWSRSSNTCIGQTLAAGASCTFDAAFSPTGLGARSGTLGVIAVPGGSAGTLVSGTGVATAANLVFDPTTRAYNPIPSGGSFTTPVYITNTGEADSGPLVFESGTPLTSNVSNIGFVPGIPNGSPHPPCGATLPGNSTCGGFMTWSANGALVPTEASLKVTATPGGTSNFTATFG